MREQVRLQATCTQRTSLCFLVLLFAGRVVPDDLGGPEQPTDSYIAGYAAAVLELEFNLRAPSLQVTDGVITIHSGDLAGHEQKKIVDVLSSIRGAVRVDILEQDSPTTDLGWEIPFPNSRLFRYLEADPRWPHFSAAYQYYIDDRGLEHVCAASLGETLGLYQDNFFLGGQWQLGLQGAVFPIFDIATSSKDLVNADYLVALPFTYRYKMFSALARFSHQSSHLGDEFIFENQPARRVNVSYESVDLKLSYDMFDDAVRLYGGGGYLVNRNPSDLQPWTAQFGLELKSQKTFFGGLVRPLIAADVQNRQEGDFDLSVRGGFQVESPKLRKLQLHFLVEYFNGQSPNGQFFESDVEYVGVGVHFFYE
jgi:hypothetical protein